ncbi:MAG: Kelch repeat-containing protein [Acidimicrobiales bacterium]
MIAGGLGTNETSIPTADLYNPTPGVWSATGGMKIRRTAHTATRLLNGRVLVAGGLDQQASGVAVHATAELYRPITQTWTLTDELGTPRALHSATRLLDGRVLVAGGFSDFDVLASAELYDPLSKTWSPVGNMAVGRYGHTATLLANGDVLAVGGHSGSGLALATAELFDSSSGAWAPASSMATLRSYHQAARLSNGNVLVAGGVSDAAPLPPGFMGLAEAEVYDANAGTWNATGSMNTRRFAHTLTRLPDGTVLAAAGEDADISVLQSSETYDPTGGEWTVGPDLTSLRATHTATLLTNGRVLVAGGFFLNNTLFTAELYG